MTVPKMGGICSNACIVSEGETESKTKEGEISYIREIYTKGRNGFRLTGCYAAIVCLSRDRKATKEYVK